MFGMQSAGGRTLLGVYDVIPLVLGRAKAALFHAVMTSVRRRPSTHVLTLSAYTHDFLRDQFQISAARIHIARPGVGSYGHNDFASTGDSDPYALFVGRLSLHKGIETLRLAYDLLPPDVRPRLVMVLPPVDATSSTADSLRRAGIDIRSDLTDRDLGALIAHAAVVVVPSLCEGYGLPLAEAAALKRPVIASDLPVFREFGVEGVTWVEPGCPDKLSEALRYADLLPNAYFEPEPPTWSAWRAGVASAIACTFVED